MWLLIFLTLCLRKSRQRRNYLVTTQPPTSLRTMAPRPPPSFFNLLFASSISVLVVLSSVTQPPFIGGLFSFPNPILSYPSTYALSLPLCPSLPLPPKDHSSQGLSLAPLHPELPVCMPPSQFFFFSLYCFSFLYGGG